MKTRPSSELTAAATDHMDSSDEVAIDRAAADRTWHERFWRDAQARNASLAEAIDFQADLEFLSYLASREWSDTPRRLRTRALRILLRRFGKLAIRQLLAAAKSVSPSPVRLTLRVRRDSELPDGGRSRREFERDYEDARLLLAYEGHKAAGSAHEEAMAAAARDVGTFSRGAEGVKKALNRARKRARKRGFVEPLAPVLAAWTDQVEQPRLRVAELATRGRPKKRRSSD